MNIDKNNGNTLLLKIINKSFCFDKSIIKESSLNKINIIIDILTLKNDSKIVKIGHGTNSCVYCFNSKIIKIGFFKLNRLIINHPRIIKVYFKDNIELLHNDNIIKIGIEIQDLAVLNDSINIDMLYDIYKDLRDDGILWTDIKSNNVGYVNKKLVVIDTDDCYIINNNKLKLNYVNDIAYKFNLMYNKCTEVDKNE